MIRAFDRSVRNRDIVWVWIVEAATVAAFLIFALAVMFAPYLLGFLPEVEAEFMRAAQ